jgi:hypothetical protein
MNHGVDSLEYSTEPHSEAEVRLIYIYRATPSII